MAVADASALVAALTDSSQHSAWARDALFGEDLAAPELLLAESTNTLRSMERRGDLSAADAAAAYDRLLRFDVQLHPFAPYAARIWELRHNLTPYDAWYVAIAESLGCPLITLDRRLTRAPGPTCPILAPP